MTGAHGGGEGLRSGSLNADDGSRVGKAEVVESYGDAIEKTTSAYRADDGVGGGVGHLVGDLVHEAGVSGPDVGMVERWGVDGCFAGLLSFC